MIRIRKERKEKLRNKPEQIGGMNQAFITRRMRLTDCSAAIFTNCG